MPVSQENESVLKGKVAPKAPPNNPADEDIEEEKDDGMGQKTVRPEDVAMGINGDVERQFKMLGFADQASVPRHHYVNGVDVVLPLRG